MNEVGTCGWCNGELKTYHIDHVLNCKVCHPCYQKYIRFFKKCESEMKVEDSIRALCRFAVQTRVKAQKRKGSLAERYMKNTEQKLLPMVKQWAGSLGGKAKLDTVSETATALATTPERCDIILSGARTIITGKPPAPCKVRRPIPPGFQEQKALEKFLTTGKLPR